MAKPTFLEPDDDALNGAYDSDTRYPESVEAPTDRMAQGVGQAERNQVTVTRQGRFPGDQGGVGGGDLSQGEVPGAGSTYSAFLNERPNLSNPRNQGPTRAPSREGAAKVPVVSMNSRHTGKIGGGV